MNAGRCVAAGDGLDYRCTEQGEEIVTLTRARSGTPLSVLGRRDVVAGPYCAVHGGVERARALAVHDWAYLAPDAVGDDKAVIAAGNLSLTSPDAYVVVRRTPDERRPALWTVRITREQGDAARAVEARDPRLRGALCALGLWRGTMVTRDEGRARQVAERVRELYDVEPTLAFRAAGTHAVRRPWLAQLGVGGMLVHVGAYEAREQALGAGRRAWRTAVDANVAAILSARGGTLEWGVPVAPLDKPIVLEPAEGESGWDVAGRTPRRTASGVCWVSGLRASGEPC